MRKALAIAATIGLVAAVWYSPRFGDGPDMISPTAAVLNDVAWTVKELETCRRDGVAMTREACVPVVGAELVVDVGGDWYKIEFDGGDPGVGGSRWGWLNRYGSYPDELSKRKPPHVVVSRDGRFRAVVVCDPAEPTDEDRCEQFLRAQYRVVDYPPTSDGAKDGDDSVAVSAVEHGRVKSSRRPKWYTAIAVRPSICGQTVTGINGTWITPSGWNVYDDNDVIEIVVVGTEDDSPPPNCGDPVVGLPMIMVAYSDHELDGEYVVDNGCEGPTDGPCRMRSHVTVEHRSFTGRADFEPIWTAEAT